MKWRYILLEKERENVFKLYIVLIWTLNESFLNCFTWELVDGQYLQVACTDIAIGKRDARIITNTEYDLVFLRWPIQIVMYDEPELYVELSHQVCMILNRFMYHAESVIVEIINECTVQVEEKEKYQNYVHGNNFRKLVINRVY
jgi:hypothetical protein